MKVPKFLYGSHSTVTRASIRMAEAFVEKGPSGMDYGEMIDTSTSDARLLIDSFPGAKGFLFYGPLEAFARYHLDRLRNDPAFAASFVSHWLEWDWSLLCLMPMPSGGKLMDRSHLAWRFVQALDRAWPEFTEFGTRFGPSVLPGELSGHLTTMRVIVARYISSPEQPVGVLSMTQTHEAIRRILSEGEREPPRWDLGPGTTSRSGSPT